VPERAWRWQNRIGFGPDRSVPLDWGSDLWNWDVSAYESADGIRLAKTRAGRAFDDDNVVFEATFMLLRDVVDAAGGLEAAYGRLVAAVASAQERLDKLVAETSFSKSGPEPEFGWGFSDPTLEDAWYALEEMIIWARTFDQRLRRPAQDKKRYPDQGLIPALAAGPRREATITARSRLVGSHLNEVRYLAGLNLHMQSTKAGSVQARVRDGQLVLRFPDRVAGWISHRWQLSYSQGRDAVAYADGLMRAVEQFMEEMLSAFELHVPARFKAT
jgi:hypothetical protein